MNLQPTRRRHGAARPDIDAGFGGSGLARVRVSIRALFDRRLERAHRCGPLSVPLTMMVVRISGTGSFGPALGTAAASIYPAWMASKLTVRAALTCP
jgi:hypothetical protein